MADGEGSRNYLKYILLLYLFEFLSSCVAKVSGILKIAINFKNKTTAVYNIILSNILYNSMSFFYSNSKSHIAYLIKNIAAVFLDIVEDIVNEIAPIIIVCLYFLTYVFLIKKNVFFITILYIGIYQIFFIYVSKYFLKNFVFDESYENDFTNLLEDILTNIYSVKTFGTERIEKIKLLQERKRAVEYRKKYDLGAILFRLCEDLIYIILNVVYIISIYLLLKNNIGSTLIMYIVVNNLNKQINTFFRTLKKIYNNYINIRRYIKEMEDRGKKIDNEETKVILKNISGKIRFNDIDFKYENGTKIFNKLNLEIEPFEKIVIVGRSGVGKSSLVSLLMRIYDLEESQGYIEIDNINIKNCTLKSLQNNISYISQDTPLFRRTIRENIIYGGTKISEEEIISATKKACCYDFIRQLENGFETIIGKNGLDLSHGQRQRILIARAILKNSKILILDEAMNALDSETEKEIVLSLNDVMVDKTVIIITHRLSVLKNINIDRIITLKDGGVVNYVQKNIV